MKEARAWSCPAERRAGVHVGVAWTGGRGQRLESRLIGCYPDACLRQGPRTVQAMVSLVDTSEPPGFCPGVLGKL